MINLTTQQAEENAQKQKNKCTAYGHSYKNGLVNLQEDAHKRIKIAIIPNTSYVTYIK